VWSPSGDSIAYERSGYPSQIWKMNSTGEPFGFKQLTTGTDEQFPSWSPDGTEIAFASNRSGNWEIYVMDTRGEVYGIRQLTYNTSDDLKPTWSPDGSRIAFMSARSGNWDIWAMDVMDGEGSMLIQLTCDPSSDDTPAWSPDGSKIAFTSERSGNSDIWILSDLPFTSAGSRLKTSHTRNLEVRVQRNSLTQPHSIKNDAILRNLPQ